MTNSPVVVPTIAGCSARSRGEPFWRLLPIGIAHFPDVTALLPLDHAPSYEDCARAIEAGFASVMTDGRLPEDRVTHASFGENVAATAASRTLPCPRFVRFAPDVAGVRRTKRGPGRLGRPGLRVSG